MQPFEKRQIVPIRNPVVQGTFKRTIINGHRYEPDLLDLMALANAQVDAFMDPSCPSR